MAWENLSVKTTAGVSVPFLIVSAGLLGYRIVFETKRKSWSGARRWSLATAGVSWLALLVAVVIELVDTAVIYQNYSERWRQGKQFGIIRNLMVLVTLYAAKGSFIATAFTISTNPTGTIRKTLWTSLSSVVVCFTATMLSLLLWCRPLPVGKVRNMTCEPLMDKDYLIVQGVLDSFSTIFVIVLSLSILRASSCKSLTATELAFTTLLTFLASTTFLLNIIQIPIVVLATNDMYAIFPDNMGLGRVPYWFIPGPRTENSVGALPLLSIVSGAMGVTTICLPALRGRCIAYKNREVNTNGGVPVRNEEEKGRKDVESRGESYLEKLLPVKRRELHAEVGKDSTDVSLSGLRVNEVVPSASCESLGLYS